MADIIQVNIEDVKIVEIAYSPEACRCPFGCRRGRGSNITYIVWEASGAVVDQVRVKCCTMHSKSSILTYAHAKLEERANQKAWGNI